MTLSFPSVAGRATTLAPSPQTHTTLDILAHRGVWTEPSERNTLAAFERAFAHGSGAAGSTFATSTATLVVSHDPPVHGALPLADVVDAYRAAGQPGRLALNIKADGLQALVAAALARRAPVRLVHVRHVCAGRARLAAPRAPDLYPPLGRRARARSPRRGRGRVARRLRRRLDHRGARRIAPRCRPSRSRSSRPNSTAAIPRPPGAPGGAGVWTRHLSICTDYPETLEGLR